jgi:Phage antitermination protein Q
MARIEYIKHRLNNWALWRAREAAGGLGFATRSVLLSEPASGYRESKMPIDDTDASITNEAVESLKLPKPHLYQTLQAIYIQDAGAKAAASRLGKAPSTISAHLEQSDAYLSIWFRARAERLKK